MDFDSIKVTVMPGIDSSTIQKTLAYTLAYLCRTWHEVLHDNTDTISSEDQTGCSCAHRTSYRQDILYAHQSRCDIEGD